MKLILHSNKNNKQNSQNIQELSRQENCFSFLSYKMDINKIYEELITHLKNTFYIESSLKLLEWDAQVNLPPNSGDIRSAQNAALSKEVHAKVIDPKVGIWLDQLESKSEKLSSQQLTVVRETRKEYNKAIKLPGEFVAKKSEAECLAYLAWVEARKKDDFTSFIPHLQKQLDFAIQEAEYVGSHANPYDYALDKHDPGLSADFVEKQFSELKKGLIPIVDQITDSTIKAKKSLFKHFPIPQQKEFVQEVIEKLGFDFSRGRIDQSPHPFCGGNGLDTRITTRYDENIPLFSLFAAIHETGHALYEQGLPQEHIGTPLGDHIGMAVHESQSRLWENQVGRSRAFWKFWEPRYRELFADQLKGISSEALYLAINAVERGPIRVDSDEVTYNLHIILRFELEKKLFDRTLKIQDLPEAWNQASKEILKLSPKNNKEGVLQDVHWSVGAFGYFPSYCLGNMIAAQLWYTVNKIIPSLEENIAAGNIQPLLQWLRSNIHQYGKQYDTQELVKKTTNESLSPKALIQYLSERYLPLYLN